MSSHDANQHDLLGLNEPGAQHEPSLSPVAQEAQSIVRSVALLRVSQGSDGEAAIARQRPGSQSAVAEAINWGFPKLLDLAAKCDTPHAEAAKKLSELAELCENTNSLFVAFLDQHTVDKSDQHEVQLFLKRMIDDEDVQARDTLREEWVDLMRDLQPLNQKVLVILRELRDKYRTHCDCFQQLSNHACEMEILLTRWDKGTWRRTHPTTFYPDGIHEWARQQYVRHLQVSLMGWAAVGREWAAAVSRYVQMKFTNGLGSSKSLRTGRLKAPAHHPG